MFQVENRYYIRAMDIFTFVTYLTNLNKLYIKCSIYLNKDERENCFSADKLVVSYITRVMCLRYIFFKNSHLAISIQLIVESQ